MAQQFTTLVSFTNVWRYDQSGADLGTEWRTNDFDDSAWPSGPGLLGFEDTPQVYSTHATLLTSLTVSPAVTTFYFRTTFQFDGAAETMKLFATNLVDDGCAIFLNGKLAGGVRMPPGFIGTTTFSGPAVEGQLDVVVLTNFLRVGVNQLAVEVHQSAATSADVMFGMRLVAVNETPLVITNQPQSQNVLVGESVTLTVGVAGGPAAYRWQRNGVNLGSTNSSLVFPNVQPANAGDYRVICSNSLSVIASSVATLSVFADLAGPKVLSAIAESDFGPRTILIRFSEPIAASSARAISNYGITRLDTGNTVTITNTLYSVSLGVLLQIDANEPDWIRYGDYALTINNLTDSRTNSIAPNTRVPVSWPYVTNLISGNLEWDFHDIAVFDPGVFEERWSDPAFLPGPWWGRGNGAFQGGPTPQFSCRSIASPQTAISYQPEPTLFRTSFQWPAHWSTSGTLRLRYGADDGLVVFLNGKEIHRYNAAAVGTPVTGNSRAAQSVQQAFCNTNVTVDATNLLPGTNWIAVALLQSFVDQDSYFVFDMKGVALIAPELPHEPLPALQVTPSGADRVSFSWSGHGYALETSTNLDLATLSYPAGPWLEVPQMSNPYSWDLTNGPQRFFRLRK